MLPFFRNKKRLRIAGVVALVLMAAYAGTGSYLSHYYKGLILARLPALAAKATDSLYDITVQDIRINIFTRAVTVTGMRMSINLDVLQRRNAEGRPPHVILDVTVPEAEVSGVKWNELKQERELTCRAVTFRQPQIRVQVLPGWRQKIPRIKARHPTVSRVYAQRITIEEPVFDVRYSYGADGFTVQSTGGLIKATDWDYHPGKPFDTSRFFAAAAADVQLDGLSYIYPDPLYRYDLGSIRFRSGEGLLRLSGVHIRPAMSNEAMYEKIGHRRDIYECQLPSLTVEGLQWKRLLAADHALLADRIALDAPQLSIYLSKRPPPNPAPKPAYYPSQWLHRLTLPVSIGLVSVWNGAVRYTETNGKTGATGTLDFSYLRANMTGVSNMPEAAASRPDCYAFITGKLAHRADVAAVIRFPLASVKGAFSLSGRLRGLDAGGIRETIRAMAVADVTSLRVPDVTARMAGNEDSVWGAAAIQYNKLRVKLQKWDPDDSDIHSRVLLTFLANKLLLYDANPMPGQSLRTATIGLPRGVTRSFFQMVWKGLFQACVETAIRDEGAYDIVQRRKAAKDKPKQHFFKGLFPKRR